MNKTFFYYKETFDEPVKNHLWPTIDKLLANTRDKVKKKMIGLPKASFEENIPRAVIINALDNERWKNPVVKVVLL